MIELLSDIDLTNFHLFPEIHFLQHSLLHCPLLPGDGGKPHKARQVLASSWSHWGSSQGLSLIQSSDQTIVFTPWSQVGSVKIIPYHKMVAAKLQKQETVCTINYYRIEKNHHIFNDRPLETERVIVISLRRSSGRYQINAMLLFF